MKKIAAIGLTVMLSGLGWAGVKLINHGERLAVVEEKEKTNRDLLKEVRVDVKEILKAVK